LVNLTEVCKFNQIFLYTGEGEQKRKEREENTYTLLGRVLATQKL